MILLTPIHEKYQEVIYTKAIASMKATIKGEFSFVYVKVNHKAWRLRNDSLIVETLLQSSEETRVHHLSELLL